MGMKRADKITDLALGVSLAAAHTQVGQRIRKKFEL